MRNSHIQDDFEVGEKFEESVIQYLSRHALSVDRTGYEHSFKKLDRYVHADTTGLGLLLRHFPDGLVVNGTGRISFWEAKSSINIEKTAYEQYQKFIPENLLIFCRDSKLNVYQQYLTNIRFRNSTKVVSQYQNPHPIDSDGWICPSNANGWSGKPYREIDLSSMIAIPDFDATT